MIRVEHLNGKVFWINPHQIESMEQNPDLTLTLLSGKKVVIKGTPEEFVGKIVEYRKKIGMQEL